MSRLVAFAAIQGAYNIISKAEGAFKRAMDKYGANQPLAFPNTAYYLPVIYSILGMKVEKVSDAEPVLARCKALLPPHMRTKGNIHTPYLGHLLDAGMAAILAEEIVEAIRYVEDPDFYLPGEDCDLDNGKMWLGAADDVIMRKRGVEFVDGSAPGFAAIVGAAPSPEIAKMIVEDYQKKNLYIFLAANQAGTTVAQQLVDAGVQIGWGTRIVPFGPDISAAVFALGFANRAGMAFGGIQPGDYKAILKYNKDRVFAFVNALGEVNAEWAANAAGAVNWGFPTLADTDIPEILPTGVCTYEHVVANVPHEQMTARSIEVRGLKVTITEIPVPVSYGPAFEGERVRKDDVYVECGGGKTPCFELVQIADMADVEDGRVEVFGPDIPDIQAGSRLPLAVTVQVAGRKMQADYEPILERQIHHLVNYAQGIMHIGQRDIAWYRIGKAAVEKGFTLEHIGKILHAKYHQDFGAIFDKCQVKIYTEEAKVKDMLHAAQASYNLRDARVENMTDETCETYYSCTLCQSFAPTHVCVISPERTGLCGAYNWLDCKASPPQKPACFPARRTPRRCPGCKARRRFADGGQKGSAIHWNSAGRETHMHTPRRRGSRTGHRFESHAGSKAPPGQRAGRPRGRWAGPCAARRSPRPVRSGTASPGRPGLGSAAWGRSVCHPTRRFWSACGWPPVNPAGARPPGWHTRSKAWPSE